MSDGADELSPEDIGDARFSDFVGDVRAILDRAGFRETRILPRGSRTRYDPYCAEGYRCFRSFDPPEGWTPPEGHDQYLTLRSKVKERTTLKAMAKVLNDAGIETFLGATRFCPLPLGDPAMVPQIVPLLRLLFLDIDGVLNGQYDWEDIYSRGLYDSAMRDFRQRNLARFRRVIRETGARVVMISSKRKTWGDAGIRQLFHDAETGIQIDYVLPLRDANGEDSDDRVSMIRAMLQTIPGVSQWAVVDDTVGYGWMSDPEFAERTVIPNGDDGLSDSDTEKLVRILKSSPSHTI